MRFHLEMVTETHLDIEQNVELESVNTEGECVIDGILPQGTRGEVHKSAAATKY